MRTVPGESCQNSTTTIYRSVNLAKNTHFYTYLTFTYTISFLFFSRCAISSHLFHQRMVCCIVPVLIGIFATLNANWVQLEFIFAKIFQLMMQRTHLQKARVTILCLELKATSQVHIWLGSRLLSCPRTFLLTFPRPLPQVLSPETCLLLAFNPLPHPDRSHPVFRELILPLAQRLICLVPLG